MGKLIKFSILTVCLNAGDKLAKTIESVLAQTYDNFEIIVKDGGSTDGSLTALDKYRNSDGMLKLSEKYRKDDGMRRAPDTACPDDMAAPRIRLVEEKDTSIYDAMNQAIRVATGDYYIFLNCGDYLMDETVLARCAKHIVATKADILYGDQYLQTVGCVVPSPKKLTDFTCYRNIPCHQVCFYHKRLFASRGYDLQYPVRADYEHFLWCKYKANAKICAMDFPVCSYEGEGFSETGKRVRMARQEHKKITKQYLGVKCIGYQFVMWITLQPLRKRMAESKTFSAFYQRVKRLLYRR
ncbi:MAG: glycosyltransferase family 2 protein [Lachnospiraceae bacterium]